MSEAETRRHFACDDLVPHPSLVAWRGVSVAAPPEVVWPWVGQIRLAPYSYDWVDNLGQRSPRTLRDLPEPAVGDPFTCCDGRPLGRLMDVVPGRSLTGRFLGATMTYAVVPSTSGTRLLLKIVMATNPVLAQAICLGDLVMARRQLLNLKALAEG